MMKLRVRCMESKETLKIQTLSPSTLHDLKTAIADNTSSLPETLHLSLNRKDELLSSPHESLQSLGLTSGDLVFYTTNPNLFSSETAIPKKSSQFQESRSESDQTLTLNPDPQNKIEKPMNIYVYKPSSVSCFLRNVFNEESVNVTDDIRVLIVAVHAVFLEYGFVGFDSAGKKGIDGFRLPEGWTSETTGISIKYTIPSLLNCYSSVIESVNLKFQILGKFVFVYGCLSNNGSNLYRLSLDLSLFAPSIKVICAMNEMDASSSEPVIEREIYAFWKNVKDELSLPLHMDLCERTGLLLPACFKLLPHELKIRVLEFLPGSDISKVACVCLELRNMATIDDLWKKKYAEEFGLFDERSVRECGNWKEKFKTCWMRKRRKRVSPLQPINSMSVAPRYNPGRRILPPPLGMLGGDFDRFPVIGGRVPFPVRQDFPRLPARRNFQLG